MFLGGGGETFTLLILVSGYLTDSGFITDVCGSFSEDSEAPSSSAGTSFSEQLFDELTNQGPGCPHVEGEMTNKGVVLVVVSSLPVMSLTYQSVEIPLTSYYGMFSSFPSPDPPPP